MTIRMTYDQKAKMGYLYLFPETFTPAIEETDELEENEFLNVDVDQEGRIVGIEFFNEEANVIRAVHSQAFLLRRTYRSFLAPIAKHDSEKFVSPPRSYVLLC
ncbi:DUF2283 domain-containing protein [Exiguobacterium sp. FSL W8-0210]|uniref:DUF2283 domain-containing protein n=1 Tax=Exiguobacterium sp. FSL W8-0210 TaxID=2921598 RepID=UPI0030F8CD79